MVAERGMGRLGGFAAPGWFRSLGLTTNRKEARAGSLDPPGHGRCSFATKRGLPARNTLRPRRGATQGLSAARITRTANVPWQATARTGGRPRPARGFLAGTAERAIRRSAFWPTAWRRGCRARSTIWRQLSSRPRARRARRRRRTSCAAPKDDDAVELPGAIRWVRHRVRLVHDILVRVIGLIPGRLAGCAATMVAVRERLKSDSALMALRGLVSAQLRTLPAPLGFQPHGIGVGGRNPALQHSMGPDPPPAGA